MSKELTLMHLACTLIYKSKYLWENVIARTSIPSASKECH
jgi:hypothetical protein